MPSNEGGDALNIYEVFMVLIGFGTLLIALLTLVVVMINKK